MKKICFLVGSLNCSGGTERVTTIIANELSKLNYEVLILSLENGDNPFFELQENVKTYTLYSKNVSFKKNFLGIVWKIRKFIRQHQIDTFISVESISCIFTIPALYGSNIKHICWEHFNFNVNLGVKYRDIGRKWAAKYCDYVVTLTKRDKSLWEKGLNIVKAKIISIPNPTPFENVEHNPSQDSKVILSVGRYRYQKGYDLLMYAWGQIQNKKGWKLIIVGEGEDKQKIIELTKKLKIENTVELHLATTNIAQYFEKASIYCMSSRFEGLPMVLLEAQSFGLPIVSFDCDTGPAELIEENITGYLVEPENIDELSLKINAMINLDQETYLKMSECAKENINNFKVSEIIKNWINII